ncbi:efflux RND transporter periplasmic adaptor subunit [Thiofilum flexile]|uniref:efflux RND transporter periplasmic adaptor subunit n=1 Tax=Thiofilum flexile TaxID=125627 RepID=UPI0003742ED5|nr:efflux RND transporter periplasmic adaptor subunit [Thiofilum flexile]
MSIKSWLVLSLSLAMLSACKEKEVEQPEPTRPAQVWRVQAQISEQVDTYSGEVQPHKVTSLSFRVAGKVVGRSVEIGETVKVGQVLAQLDNEDAELSVKQTESNLDAAKSSLQTSQANLLALQNNVTASQGAVSSARGNVEAARGRLSTAQGNLIAMQTGLESAQAGVESAQAGVASARATYESARAAVGSAQAELKNAQLEYNRSAKLNQQGYLSTTILDQHRQRVTAAQASYKSVYANAQAALAQVNAAQTKIKTAQTQIKTTQAQIKAAEGDVSAARASVVAAEGQVKTAEAQVESAQAQADAARGQVGSAQAQINTITEQTKLAKNQSRYTELTSTVSGIVTGTPVEIGQVVGVGQTIVNIANSKDLEVQIKLSEQAIKLVQVGTPAKIKLWAVSDTFEGMVAEIAPLADANRLWLVKVTIKNPSVDLRLGMTATVTFSKSLPKTVSWLPATALFQSDQQPAVWIVSADNKTELKPIEIENYLDGGLLVSGLDEGLTVVAAGVNRIHQGQDIIPTPYTGQARPIGQ